MHASDEQLRCPSPPEYLNTKHTKAHTYRLGTSVEYQCDNWYVNIPTFKSKLVCNITTQGVPTWFGDKPTCQIAAEKGDVCFLQKKN